MDTTFAPIDTYPAIVRVSGYVDRGFDDVTQDLDGPQGRATFSHAFYEGTGTEVEPTTTREIPEPATTGAHGGVRP